MIRPKAMLRAYISRGGASRTKKQEPRIFHPSGELIFAAIEQFPFGRGYLDGRRPLDCFGVLYVIVRGLRISSDEYIL